LQNRSAAIQDSDLLQSFPSAQSSREGSAAPPSFHLWLTTFSSQVFRWSALGLGVAYGFFHQRSIKAQDNAAKSSREYAHQAQLISQAKLEFAKKNAPAPVVSSSQAAAPKSEFDSYSNGGRGRDMCWAA